MSEVQENLEQEGKVQIEQALKSVGLEDIDNLDPDEDEPIQEGAEPGHCPDEADWLDIDILVHERAERDMGAK